MREILFRGKSVDTKEWVYGFFFYELGSLIKERPSSISTCTHLVDPDTVGQFIGMTDNNGVKIFEGDIIKWKDWDGNYHEQSVLYDPEWNRFCGWLSGVESFGVNKHLSQDIKVVGNIYDND